MNNLVDTLIRLNLTFRKQAQERFQARAPSFTGRGHIVTHPVCVCARPRRLPHSSWTLAWTRCSTSGTSSGPCWTPRHCGCGRRSGLAAMTRHVPCANGCGARSNNSSPSRSAARRGCLPRSSVGTSPPPSGRSWRTRHGRAPARAAARSGHPRTQIDFEIVRRREIAHGGTGAPGARLAGRPFNARGHRAQGSWLRSRLRSCAWPAATCGAPRSPPMSALH
jgi:hypothetical protein